MKRIVINAVALGVPLLLFIGLLAVARGAPDVPQYTLRVAPDQLLSGVLIERTLLCVLLVSIPISVSILSRRAKKNGRSRLTTVAGLLGGAFAIDGFLLTAFVVGTQNSADDLGKGADLMVLNALSLFMLIGGITTTIVCAAVAAKLRDRKIASSN